MERFGAMDRFDVVVVGAGSAGAVLAGRLSERPGRRVLLLEAGPDHRSADAPAGVAGPNFFAALEVPGRTWPGLLAVRAPGRPPAPYLRGRGVGGSSAVNAMMALRGIPEDHDRWAHELGCPGWSWADMLPRFLRAEDDVDYGGDGLHGRGGPLPLARPAPGERSPLDVAVGTALAELGHPSAPDYHAPGATGVSPCALTMRQGRRVSTADAYLEPARWRPGLQVRGDVLVDRVALEGSRAVGVVTATGERIAAGEVILSAGAIHSPTILLRSGIGPEMGLAVGAGLVDHPATPALELTLRPEGRPTSGERPPLGSVLRYSSGLEGVGPNDLQVVWFSPGGVGEAGRATAFLMGGVMRAFSRGHVRLGGADPALAPEIDLRLVDDERDRRRLRALGRHLVAVVRHPAVARLVESVGVGSAVALEAPDDDRAMDAWLESGPGGFVHAGGTCRMGTPGDPAAVVDPQCRVIGFRGLRVCDASVMPDLPRANPHLTVVAIAEGLAGMMG